MVTRFAEAGKIRSSPRDGTLPGEPVLAGRPVGAVAAHPGPRPCLRKSLARTHDRRPDDRIDASPQTEARCREQASRANPSQRERAGPDHPARCQLPVTAHGQHPADDVLGSNRADQASKDCPRAGGAPAARQPTAAPPPRGEPSDAGRSGTAEHRPRRTHPRTRGRRSRPRRPESSGACSCRSREIERCSRAEEALASTRRRDPSPYGMRRDSSRL